MSVELELVRVSKRVMAKYGKDPLLAAVWESRYVMDMAGDDEDVVREYVEGLFAEDGAEAWSRFERLMRDGDLPDERLHVGSEWKRLETLFEREADPARRALLQATFYGLTEPKVRLEASYGACKLVEPAAAAEIAVALRKVDLQYLQSLSDDGTADAKADDMMDGFLEGIAKSIGLPAGALSKAGFTDEFMQAMASVTASKQSVTGEDFDVELASELADFYERAAKDGATVICGIV